MPAYESHFFATREESPLILFAKEYLYKFVPRKLFAREVLTTEGANRRLRKFFSAFPRPERMRYPQLPSSYLLQPRNWQIR